MLLRTTKACINGATRLNMSSRCRAGDGGCSAIAPRLASSSATCSAYSLN